MPKASTTSAAISREVLPPQLLCGCLFLPCFRGGAVGGGVWQRNSFNSRVKTMLAKLKTYANERNVKL